MDVFRAATAIINSGLFGFERLNVSEIHAKQAGNPRRMAGQDDKRA
jgi:hypothetical protein